MISAWSLVCSKIQFCVSTTNFYSLGNRNQRNQIHLRLFMCVEKIFMNLLINKLKHFIIMTVFVRLKTNSRQRVE